MIQQSKKPANKHRDVADLEDIPNIGPAIAADLRQLGIVSPAELPCRIKWPQTPTYPLVAEPKNLLNPLKKYPNGPRDSFLGRSRSAASAGLKVRALKAEKMTDTAMVTANCW